jgi:UDP-N-acetylmuramate dehydrogenase
VKQEQKEYLAALLGRPLEYNCHLSRFTSFAIGGPAEVMVRVENYGELQALLRFLAEEIIPWRIIGKGTNLLVSDAGFGGVVFRLGGDLTTVSERVCGDGSVLVHCGAGSSLSALAMRCSEQGLSGLEFACGIPGTIGGAVIMNAGAWGKDIGSILQKVTLVTGDGEIHLDAGALDFSYRSCKGFARYQAKAVVAAVELRLCRGDAQAILADCKALLAKRKATQPHDHASAGSFFKNPSGYSAGRLIEASGLKGLRVGGAMISEKHGNFLVNTGGATAADVVALMKIVQEKVKNDSGISLEPEVHFL